jgi:carbamoyl-phosphate synthase large subunit
MLYQRTLLEANKRFADRQIAHMMGCLESQVHTLRMEMNINRVLNWLILAAEFKAKTPYYYYF